MAFTNWTFTSAPISRLYVAISLRVLPSSSFYRSKVVFTYLVFEGVDMVASIYVYDDVFGFFYL